MYRCPGQIDTMAIDEMDKSIVPLREAIMVFLYFHLTPFRPHIMHCDLRNGSINFFSDPNMFPVPESLPHGTHNIKTLEPDAFQTMFHFAGAARWGPEKELFWDLLPWQSQTGFRCYLGKNHLGENHAVMVFIDLVTVPPPPPPPHSRV